MADAGLVGLLAGFGRELRGSGVTVGSGDILTFCAAMEPLDPKGFFYAYLDIALKK